MSEHRRPRRSGRAVHHGGPAALPLLPGRRQAIPERERRRVRPAPGPGAALQPARGGTASAGARRAGLLGGRARVRPAPPARAASCAGPALGRPDHGSRRPLTFVTAHAAHRRRHRRAVRRRSPAPLREPRLRGQHARAGRRVGGGRGVPAVVQQRAPGQRAQVAGLDRRVRGRARTPSPTSWAPAATTPSSSSATRLRRSTSSRRRCPRARGCSRARSSTTRRCSPGGGTTCACCDFAGSPDELLDRCAQALRAARTDLVAVTGASNVTGRGVAGRRAGRARASRTERGCSSTRRSSPRTVRSTWPARASTSWPSPATSCTRRSVPARSSAPLAS